MILKAMQALTIATVRPYVSRELPGWGKLFSFVDSHCRGWLWANAPVKTIRGKLHGYTMHLNLAGWTDRHAYFLGRWHDLATQLFMFSYIRPGDLVIDVGANRGMFALVASKLVGSDGRVLCFEPNPECLRVLLNEIETNGISNITLQQFALGNCNEELMLSFPEGESDQGTLANNAFGSASTYKIRSRIKVGDEVLKSEKPSFIKIDVEGFETNVIKGLAGTIRRHRPVIITEINPPFLTSCGTSFVELATLMREMNYLGYKLGLKKQKSKHDWNLTPLNDSVAEYCDAVWLPSTAQ